MEINTWWVDVKFKDPNSKSTVSMKVLVDGLSQRQAKRIAEYQLKEYALNFLSVDENDEEAFEIALDADIKKLDNAFLESEKIPKDAFISGVLETSDVKITRK